MLTEQNIAITIAKARRQELLGVIAEASDEISRIDRSLDGTDPDLEKVIS